jgi:transcriptional regulator with XRE-family HTH domain
MTLSIAQIRAARALLGWSVADLAGAAAIGVMTVHRFEGGQTVRDDSINKMRSAFNAAGVVLLSPGDASIEGGAGVRLKV